MRKGEVHSGVGRGFRKRNWNRVQRKKKRCFSSFFFFFQTKNALEQITGDDVGGKV